jgi:hypothetical protein
MRRVPSALCLCFLVSAMFVTVVATPVAAQDTWTTPSPGVRQLVRLTSGPRRVVAVEIDLTRSDLYIRATRREERGRTTTSFANHVGATVAINGDWGNASFDPVGLAVGDGAHWEGTADRGWAFIACTIDNRCVFDDHTADQERDLRWHEVVGGNGWRLLIDGQMPQYPNEAFYRTDRHPRSAVGVNADGTRMILMVIEGRREDSIGATFIETADQIRSLGAHQAMMLDGGGSSALVVAGQRISRLPSNQSSERVVTNHLAIVRGGTDGRCQALPNGRYCDGSVIHTCRGGAHRGQGDCGFFGASCVVADDGMAVCNHPYCANGPNGHYCEDRTRITRCNYGQPVGTGDCGAFGATCEDTAEDAYCVHFLCAEGANGAWCRDEGVLARCARGQPLDDVDCGASGRRCQDGACVGVATEDPGPEETAPEEPGDDDNRGEDVWTAPDTEAGPGEDVGARAETGADARGQKQTASASSCAVSVDSRTGSFDVWLLLAGLLVFCRRRARG